MTSLCMLFLLIVLIRPRKRKVRNERGEWVDPKELEGRVIEHGVEIPQTIKPKRVKRMLFHQHYYTGDDFNRGYDPFRLVPTSYYNDIVLPPFEVEIVSDALVSFHLWITIFLTFY